MNQLQADTKNYEYQQTEAGENIAISRSTGEIIPAVSVLQPAGSWVNTPTQIEKFNKRKQAENSRMLKRKANEPLGRFYFVREQGFSGLSPETVIRLIYLNTFTNYDDARLMRSERTPMRRKDLPMILGISPASVTRFWREACPKYISEDSNGLIITNREVFYKGKLTGGYNTQYRKLYLDGIRKLYSTISDTRQHKYLGYVFMLLPYINREFNILYYNIDEKDLYSIEPISLSDFCRLIHYDSSHLNRLMQIYKSLRFVVGNHTERFISLVYDGLNRQDAKIYVNPNILYDGSDYRRVEILGAFCKD